MNSIFNGCEDDCCYEQSTGCKKSQWSNVTTSSIDIFVLSNVAIGTNNPLGNALYVKGNLFVGGNTFIGNTMIGDLSLIGNSVISGNLFVGGSINTGTLNANIIKGVSSNIQNIESRLILEGSLSDETTTLTTSNFVIKRAPYPFIINSSKLPVFFLNSLSSSSTVFDILKNGNSIYSTKPSISSTTTFNASTYSTPGTLIGGSNLVLLYDQLKISVDTVGTGTPNGAKFVIYCL